nr:MAG TPA: hypothetical protein [Caudoviricetes sp.]
MSTVIVFNLLSLPCTIIILYIRYIVNRYLKLFNGNFKIFLS